MSIVISTKSYFYLDYVCHLSNNKISSATSESFRGGLYYCKYYLISLKKFSQQIKPHSLLSGQNKFFLGIMQNPNHDTFPPLQKKLLCTLLYQKTHLMVDQPHFLNLFFYNVLKIVSKLKSMTNRICFLFGKRLLHYCIFTQLSSFKLLFLPANNTCLYPCVSCWLFICWLISHMHYLCALFLL